MNEFEEIDDERYCTDCGEEIAKTAHPDIVYCSECDTLNARGIR